MGVFGIILLVLFVIVCILLVLLVVVQGENSQGLGGIFGGASDTTFGSQSGNIMTRITYIAGASFLILAFSIGFLSRTPDIPNLLNSVQNDTVVEQTENWWNVTDTKTE